MMDSTTATEFLAEVNERIDPAGLLQHIGYAVDKIQVIGETVKAFCPVHRDARFRSLVIDSKTHTFKCTIKTCPAHGGGTLVDLYAHVRRVDALAAAAQAIGALDLQVDASALDKMTGGLTAQGRAAMEAGNLEEARRLANEALSFQPSALEPRLLLSDIHKSDGDDSMACEELIAAADARIDAADYTQAEKLLDIAQALRPDSEDILLLRIRSAEAQGDTTRETGFLEQVVAAREKAGRAADNIGVLERLAALNPAKTAYRLALAAIHEERHDIRSATRELEAAGQALADAGKSAEAIPLLEKVLGYEPQRSKLRLAIVDLLLKEGEYVRAKAHVFESIDALIEKSEYKSAAESVEKWFEVEPDSLEAHLALVRIHQGHGDTDAAARHLREVANLVRKVSGVDAALEHMYKLKFMRPDDLEVRREIIAALSESMHYDRAAAELVDLAEYNHLHGNDDAARACLDEAASLEVSVPVKLQLVEMLVLRHHANGAVRLLSELAQSASSSGDARAAVEYYGRIVEIDSNNLEAAAAQLTHQWEVDALTAAGGLDAIVNRFVESGDLDGAVPVIQAGLPHAEGRPEIASTIFTASLSVADASSARAAYEMIASGLRGSAHAELLDMAERLSGLLPTDSAVLGDMAAAALATGNPGRAAAALEALSAVYQSQGDATQHGAALGRLVELRPDDLSLRQRYYDVLVALGDGRTAAEQSRVIVRAIQDSASPDAFIAAAQKHLALDADDREIRLRLAQILEEGGRREEAAGHYRRVLEAAAQMPDSDAIRIRQRLLALEPSDFEVQYDLAMHQLRTGEKTQAIPLLMAVAQSAIEFSNFPRALEAAKAGLEADPDNADFLEHLARAHRALGNEKEFDKAAAKLAAAGRTAIAAEARRERTLALLEKEQWKPAESEARKWMELAPNDYLAFEAAARAAAGQKRTKKALELLAEAATLARAAGDTAKDVDLLSQASAIEPADTSIRQELWQALLAAGRENDAIDQMTQLADILVDQLDYKGASTLLARILDYRTNSVDALERLASLVLEHEGFDKALPYYRKILGLRESADGPDAAAAEYGRILALPGASVDLRGEYAAFLERAGRGDEAKSQLIQAAQIFRDELSDPVRAIQYFAKATSINSGPADARVYEELASLHLSLKVPEFAAEALREASRLHEHAGDLSRAALNQRQAITVAGASTDDCTRLAALYEQMGDSDAAADALRQAIDQCSRETQTSRSVRVSLCEKLLASAPGDITAARMLISELPPKVAASRALQFTREMLEQGRHADAADLSRRGSQRDPSDLRLVDIGIDACRAAGDDTQAAQMLGAKAAALAEAGDAEGARKALDESLALDSVPPGLPDLAAVARKLGDESRAAELLTAHAEKRATEGDAAGAAEALTQAAGDDPAAVDAASVAHIVELTDGDSGVLAAAKDFLERALRARHQLRVQTIASAILKSQPISEVPALLEHIHESGGAGMLVSVTAKFCDFLASAGRADEAVRIVMRMTEWASSSPDAWWQQSVILRRLGRKSEAIEAARRAASMFGSAGAVTEEENAYREILKDDPADMEAHGKLARFYEREGRVDEAAETHRSLAAIAEKASAIEDLIASLRAITRLVPGDVPAREKLAAQLARTGSLAEAVEQLFTAADHLIKAGNTAAAVPLLERSLAFDRTAVAPALRLLEIARAQKDRGLAERYTEIVARIRMADNDLAGAGEVYKELVDLFPDHVAAADRLAELYLEMGDSKSYCRTMQQQGHRYAKRGDHENAIKYFEKYLEQKPADAAIMQMVIDCASALGQNAKAAQYSHSLLAASRDGADATRLKQAAMDVLRFEPKSASAHVDLATAYERLHEHTSAGEEYLEAATLHMAASAFEDAADCLNRATQADSSSAKAWKEKAALEARLGDGEAAAASYLRLADIHLGSGDFGAAETALASAVKYRPDHFETHERAAELHRRAGRVDQFVRESLWLARECLGRGDETRADAFVSAALQLAPEEPRLAEIQMELLERLGRSDELAVRLRQMADNAIAHNEWGKAVSLLEKLRDTDPQVIAVREELANAYIRTGNEMLAVDEAAFVVESQLQRMEADRARDLADLVLHNLSGKQEAWERFAGLFGANRVPDVAARYYSTAAELARTAGNRTKSVELLQRCVEQRPRWVEMWNILADELAAEGQPRDAATALEKLEALLIEDRKFAEAEQVLQRQTELLPADIQPRRRLVDLYERMGRRDARQAELERLAQVLTSTGHLEEAVEVSRELAALNPGDPEPLQRYLDLFVQLGNELEVIPDYLRLADAYAARGQFVEAVRSYELVLSVDRMNTDARKKFINFLQTTGQKTRSVAELRRLANICRASGAVAECAGALATAYGLMPGDGELCMELASVYEQTGDKQRARDMYLKAADLRRHAMPAAAADAYERCLDLDPDDTATRERYIEFLREMEDNTRLAAQLALLAEACAAKGDADRAEQARRAAEAVTPDTAERLRDLTNAATRDAGRKYYDLVRLADLLAEQGRIENALDAYRRARAINDDSPSLIRRYIDSLIQIIPEHEAVPDFIALAERHFAVGEFQEAHDLYSQVLSLDTQNAAARAGKHLAAQMLRGGN